MIDRPDRKVLVATALFPDVEYMAARQVPTELADASYETIDDIAKDMVI